MAKMFIDDLQGQIIITVVVEGATGRHLRSKCQFAFHSRSFRVRDSRRGRESRKQQVRDKVARPVNRSGFHSRKAEQLKLEQQHDQVDWGQQDVIRPGGGAWS